MCARLFLAILLSVTSLTGAAAQDTLRTHSSVTAYLQSLIEQPVSAINQDVDRLIDSIGAQQPELQSKVAGIAFDFFTSSPVMGHDAVAVHIADNWFLNGRLKLENESLYPLLHTYAEFNRSSLVGCPAPALILEDSIGALVNVRAVPSSYKILFFYDTDCSTCRKEAPLLADLIKHYQGEPLSLFAIYTQSDRPAWENYRQEVFSGIDNPNVTVYHLWDPEAASGYHKKYGVLSTPMMLLLDGQNTIIGRHLDPQALAGMLGVEQAHALQYQQLFDNVFSSFNPLSVDNVEGIIDAFAERTYNKSSLYTEVFFHLFNYLRSSEEYPKQHGALYLAEKYIVGEPAYWSEEFVDRTVNALARARLNPVGAHATDLKLRNKRDKLIYLLDGNSTYTLVFFHLIDCRQCQEEIKVLKSLAADLAAKDIKVKLVYAGRERSSWRKFIRKVPCRWQCLQDFKDESDMRTLYDLEYVPHLYLLDDDGIIIAKDIRALELIALLPLL